MSIYLDNAATTQLDREVFNEIAPYLLQNFGNPSSHHKHGRVAKNAIEQARKTIAGLLNASPAEITFTSGGTEADNMAIVSAVRSHQVKHVITTPFEHHAVLNTLEVLKTRGDIQLSFIKTDRNGNLDLNHLDDLLRYDGTSLVSVMHANNEVGNINNIELIGDICSTRKAFFHTDAVQTTGHYKHDLSKLKVHYLAASAHKFHGPKGVGFIYARKDARLSQLIHGGSQEHKHRAGTENIPGIVGLAKALEIAYRDMDRHADHVQKVKDRLIAKLQQHIPGVSFNGNSAIADKSLYTVLSVNFPFTDLTADLLNYLDQYNISVSGGSACSTGSPSHVLSALEVDRNQNTIRFSFSKFNTIHEIDYAVEKLSALYKAIAA